MHNIVILGGNFAGLSTAHYLLRHVIPLLGSTDSDKAEFKVTLISPSDHFFFKIAAPRALVSAELVPLDKPFASIPDAFNDYKPSQFNFIQGEAQAVDAATRTVSINHTGTSTKSSIAYNTLIVATGTTSSPLWTLNGDYKITTAAFEDLHKRIPLATTLLIAGGGAAGLEAAGEIAHLHKGKDITILSGSTRLLPRLQNTGVARVAEKQLESLKVKVIHGLKVISSTKLPDGKTTLNLSDGSTKTVDVYIDATGGTPNTKFLPASWLDATKRVKTDSSTLRAAQAPAGVYSIGDVASYSTGSVMDAVWAVPALCYSIWSDLSQMTEKKGRTTVGNLKEKKYKQITADMQLVPIGPKGGVGVIYGWRVPSWFVWLLKSRTFMLEKVQAGATGEQFLKP